MPLARCALCVLLALPLAAAAQERITLGIGRILTNDRLGDGEDRWRSGSYTVSVMRGEAGDEALPAEPGQLLEYRFRAELFYPGRLGGAGSDDRPFAGALTFGLQSHWQALGGEFGAGTEITATGPQTGLDEFVDWSHDLLSAPTPSRSVIDSQVPDGVHPSVGLSYALPMRVSGSVTLRPFGEMQAGVEDLVRLGGEVIWGGIGHEDLWLRDSASGQLYRGIDGPARGLALVAGADWARVGDSLWLPEEEGVIPEEERLRARAALHWTPRPGASVLYGLAWLSPEFEGQEEAQVTGSLKVTFDF